MGAANGYVVTQRALGAALRHVVWGPKVGHGPVPRAERARGSLGGQAAGHIFRDVADGVGSAQPGFYGDCCAPAYRAAGAATFYRVLSP